MIITNNEIIETLLEVRSRSGLPIRTFYPAASLLRTFQNAGDFKNQHLINYLKEQIINRCMIEVHANRREGINNNIKSYDW